MKDRVKVEKKLCARRQIARQTPRLELLGGFRLADGLGQIVEVAAKKNRAILGVLAMAPRIEVTRDRLAGLLWSDRADEQARNSLRQALVALRKDFASLDAEPLVLIGDRVALDPKHIEVDVTEFLLTSASRDLADLRRAADLYAGSFLDGLNVADAAFEDWLRETRSDLHARATRVFSSLSERLPPEECVAMTERLVAIDPLREASHLALMQAHRTLGQTALAIRQYETCRLLLKRELQAEPGEELQEFRRSLDGTPQERRSPAPDHSISIAVMPFANMSGDPGQQYVSDGITEDILTELSRFRGLSVAARLASFHFAAKGAGLAEIARQLGAMFVLEGSVRKSGERIRISAQLIDAGSGDQIWAERYDRAAQDVFALQDEVVEAIVAMLEGRMVMAGAAMVRRKPAANWSAYDFVLQGRQLCNEYKEPEAVPLLERAVAIDPEFASAHAWLAIALTMADVLGGATSRHGRAEAAAKRALELGGNDAMAHYSRALVLQWTGDFDRSRFHFDRAMMLNPADIQIRGDYASLQRMSGYPKEALATIEKAISLGPFVPRWFEIVRGEILFDLQRYADAIGALESVPQHYVSGHLYLAAARACQGDLSGAALVAAMARKFRPGLTLREVTHLYRYADRNAREHFIEALRKIGLPD